jgi:hypothetical protein
MCSENTYTLLYIRLKLYILELYRYTVSASLMRPLLWSAYLALKLQY